MTSIVIDGAHFLSKATTGIGSYARTLATTLGELGCYVAVLYGQRVQTGRRDPPLRMAGQVFGNEPPPQTRTLRLIREASFMMRVAAGRGRRSRAIGVPIDGVDLSAFEPPLPPCDQVLNADSVYQRAYRLFAMKQRFMELEVPRGLTAAHWTWPLSIKALGVPNIYTLHDVIPLKFPHFTLDRSGRSVLVHEAIARQADHIITVSQASKQQIVDLLNVPEDRISVTYQPVPRIPKIAQSDAERLVETVYGAKPGAYALFLGAIEPKKNLKRLIEAFLLADVGIPLLIVGPLGWLYDEEVALIEDIASRLRGSSITGEVRANFVAGQVRDQLPPVRRLGYLPRRHAVALLQCARFLAFPSIFEGFGLPVLEALQLGVPVLTSNTSSLPEVAGEAAVLVDPLNVDDMMRKIRLLATDADLRADLTRRGPLQAARFSRENYQMRLADAYRNVGIDISEGLAACKSLSSVQEVA